MGMASCNPDAPVPKTPLRKYATDSKTQKVCRKGEGCLQTSDPNFDQMTCGWTKEINDREQEAIDISLMCEKWKK